MSKQLVPLGGQHLAPAEALIEHRFVKLFLQSLISKSNGVLTALGVIVGVASAASDAPKFTILQLIGFYFFSVITVTFVEALNKAISQLNKNRTITLQAFEESKAAQLQLAEAKTLISEKDSLLAEQSRVLVEQEKSHSPADRRIKLEIINIDSDGILHKQWPPSRFFMIARCLPDPHFQPRNMVTIMFSRESGEEVELGIGIVHKQQTDQTYVIGLSEPRAGTEAIIALIEASETEKTARERLWLARHTSYDTVMTLRSPSHIYSFKPPITKVK